MSPNNQFCIVIRHICTSGKLPLQAKASPKNSQLCCRAVAAARELFADLRQLVAHGAADVRRRVCRDRSCGRLQGFPELFAAQAAPAAEFAHDSWLLRIADKSAQQ